MIWQKNLILSTVALTKQSHDLLNVTLVIKQYASAELICKAEGKLHVDFLKVDCGMVSIIVILVELTDLGIESTLKLNELDCGVHEHYCAQNKAQSGTCLGPHKVTTPTSLSQSKARHTPAEHIERLKTAISSFA